MLKPTTGQERTQIRTDPPNRDQAPGRLTPRQWWAYQLGIHAGYLAKRTGGADRAVINAYWTWCCAHGRPFIRVVDGRRWGLAQMEPPAHCRFGPAALEELDARLRPLAIGSRYGAGRSYVFIHARTDVIHIAARLLVEIADRVQAGHEGYRVPDENVRLADHHRN